MDGPHIGQQVSSASLRLVSDSHGGPPPVGAAHPHAVVEIRVEFDQARAAAAARAAPGGADAGHGVDVDDDVVLDAAARELRPPGLQ